MAPDEARPSLEMRMHRVERRQRRLSALLIVAAAAFAIGWTSRAVAPPSVVTARSIRMVDAENRVRAELGIDKDGAAGLFLRDADGRMRAALIHDDAQTALYLVDADGAIRVGAAQFAHGGGGFALHGEESKGAAVLYLQERRGTLTFFDEDGAVVDRLPASSPSAPPTGDRP